MNPSQSLGNDCAGGGSRASKKRRVTFGADEAEEGVEKIGANDDGVVSSAGPLTSEQVCQYLPHIQRHSLEALICRQLVQGIPLTLADLAAAPKYVPYQSSRPIIPTCREGWNGLDENLMRDILFRLNLREKVICTSMVCKAWSELKDKTPGLFVDLGCPSGPGAARQMARFMKWIPEEDARTATSLRIATDATGFSWEARSLLDDVAYLKNPRLAEPVPDSDDEDGKRERSDLRSKTLSDIREICLLGPKIKETVIITARCCGLGYSLTHFIIDENSYSGARAITEGSRSIKIDSFKLLTQENFSEALKVLEIPASLVSCHGLSDTLSNIGPPALLRTNLRVLDLTKKTTGVPAGKEVSATSFSLWALTRIVSFHYLHIHLCILHTYLEQADNIHWADLADIGQYCPMLEVLKLPMVTASDELVRTSMTALPYLCTFSLGRVVPQNLSEYVCDSTEAIQRVLVWLLLSMRRVEYFSFGHGECDGVDRELLPGIGHDGRAQVASARPQH